jgi:hypothetical protein
VCGRAVERDFGFEYVDALSDAISAATAQLQNTNPEAFAYRGVTLRGAVERGLYTALANNQELAAAYAARRCGEPAPLPAVATDLERAVAAALLDEVRPPSRWEPRRVAARVQWATARVRDRVSRARPPAVRRSRGAPVCFVLDHAKYLRFITPAVAALGDRATRIIAAFETDADDVVPFAVPTSDTPLTVRAVGIGLWQAQHLAASLDQLVAAIGDIAPGCVVVAEGGGPLDEVARQAARVVGVPALCLQQGWSPLVHSGFRNMTYDRMAVWGRGFGDLLAPYNPAQRFVVTGSPVLVPGAVTGRLAGELTGRRAISFFLQSESPWIRPKHLAQMREFIVRLADRQPETVVLVREHPGWPLAQAERAALLTHANVQLARASEWTLREVISVSRAAVSIYSTSLLEAAALGVPALIFNPTSMPSLLPDLAAESAAVQVTDVAGGLDTAGRLINDDAYHAGFRAGCERIRDRYFDGADGRGAERVAALIEDMCRVG